MSKLLLAGFQLDECEHPVENPEKIATFLHILY